MGGGFENPDPTLREWRRVGGTRNPKIAAPQDFDFFLARLARVKERSRHWILFQDLSNIPTEIGFKETTDVYHLFLLWKIISLFFRISSEFARLYLPNEMRFFDQIFSEVTKQESYGYINETS